MNDGLFLPPVKLLERKVGCLTLPQASLLLDLSQDVPVRIRDRLIRELSTAGIDVLSSSLPAQTFPCLRVRLDSDCLPDHEEGYRIEVNPGGLALAASTPLGLGLGCTTLGQLFFGAQRPEKALRIDSLQIEDWPRYSWRGMHLDVSRHFYPVDHLKRYLDILALHKINRFHWHLTDDQGWRLDIPSVPMLREVGAWRSETDGSTHGGFYTREDVETLLDHAEGLGITVIPEIDMPGHMRAALAACPELSCTQQAQPVPSTWGVFEDVLCVGRETTFDFVKTVLDYVCELFPAPWVHIGGDEVPLARWSECPHCQQRMIKESLPNTAALQGWFTARVTGLLKERGKQAIGWDEVLENDPPEGTVIMAWRGVDHGAEAAKRGYPVVMSPVQFCYFDHAQADEGEPDSFPAVLPLESVLEFSPLPPHLPEKFRSNILGGQGNLWTERITDWDHVEYMLLPRLCALATVLWDEKQEGVSTFREQLVPHLKQLRSRGYHFRELEQ